MGSVQFQIVLYSSLYFFSRSSNVVSANYRVLICYTCHFQNGSLFFVYFGFFCLQVSLVSNFCPDTGVKVVTCSVVLWGGTLETNVTGVCGECLQCMDHTGFAPAHGACALPVYTTQVPGCSPGVLSKADPAFHSLPRSKPFRFRFSVTP